MGFLAMATEHMSATLSEARTSQAASNLLTQRFLESQYRCANAPSVPPTPQAQLQQAPQQPPSCPQSQTPQDQLQQHPSWQEMLMFMQQQNQLNQGYRGNQNQLNQEQGQAQGYQPMQLQFQPSQVSQQLQLQLQPPQVAQAAGLAAPGGQPQASTPAPQPWVHPQFHLQQSLPPSSTWHAQYPAGYQQGYQPFQVAQPQALPPMQLQFQPSQVSQQLQLQLQPPQVAQASLAAPVGQPQAPTPAQSWVHPQGYQTPQAVAPSPQQQLFQLQQSLPPTSSSTWHAQSPGSQQGYQHSWQQ